MLPVQLWFSSAGHQVASLTLPWTVLLDCIFPMYVNSWIRIFVFLTVHQNIRNTTQHKSDTAIFKEAQCTLLILCCPGQQQQQVLVFKKCLSWWVCPISRIPVWKPVCSWSNESAVELQFSWLTLSKGHTRRFEFTGCLIWVGTVQDYQKSVHSAPTWLVSCKIIIWIILISLSQVKKNEQLFNM